MWKIKTYKKETNPQDAEGACIITKGIYFFKTNSKYEIMRQLTIFSINIKLNVLTIFKKFINLEEKYFLK